MNANWLLTRNNVSYSHENEKKEDDSERKHENWTQSSPFFNWATTLFLLLFFPFFFLLAKNEVVSSSPSSSIPSTWSVSQSVFRMKCASTLSLFLYSCCLIFFVTVFPLSLFSLSVYFLLSHLSSFFVQKGYLCYSGRIWFRRLVLSTSLSCFPCINRIQSVQPIPSRCSSRLEKKSKETVVVVQLQPNNNTNITSHSWIDRC